MTQNTSTAVMNRRIEAPDSLDLFPTPPWAVRAFCEHMGIKQSDNRFTAYDPCCGLGHMAEPLKEYFLHVYASDIHDYGYGEVGDFLADPDNNLFPSWKPTHQINWVFMNPPFNKALEFVEMSRRLYPDAGLAVLIRTNWMESIDRFDRLFSKRETRPHMIAVSVERIPMVKGKYDPKATTATSYSWFVWTGDVPPLETKMTWIEPGARKRLAMPSDVLIGKDLIHA